MSTTTSPPRKLLGLRTELLFAVLAGLVAVLVGGWFIRPPLQERWERRRGLTLAADGRLDEAEALLQAALDRNANDTEVAAALGRTLVGLSLARLKEDKVQEAEEYAKRAGELPPKNAEGYKARVRVWMRKQNINNIYDDMEAALAQDPPDDVFRSDLAYWLRAAGRTREAYDLVQQLLQRQPNDPELLYLAADIAHDRGDRAASAGLLDRLAADQQTLKSRLLRAAVFEEDGQPAKALELLRQAAAEQNQNREVLYLLAAALVRAGQLPEAQKVRDSLRKLGGGLPWFEDVIGSSKISFRHVNGETPMKYIQETMGSGIGWIDYDNDGWPDLFCIQGGPTGPHSGPGPALPALGASVLGLLDSARGRGPVLAAAALTPGRLAGLRPTNKLYRNNGDGTFTDVTDKVGLARANYGMGCAVGDYDNDGFDDLVVTALDGIVLYHNEKDPSAPGGRRFVDVTEKTKRPGENGIYDPQWATGCAWGDVDGDGFLDLYVCNYAELDYDNYKNCYSPKTGKRLVCSPKEFHSLHHQLFHNNGDGTFTDVSVRAHIHSPRACKGLVVIMIDLDGDGKLDIYAGNDEDRAYLFFNQGNGIFEETAEWSGVAWGPNAENVAAMGVAAADLNSTGLPSLFVTNFQDRPNVLFVNRTPQGPGNPSQPPVFEERSRETGLGPTSLARLAFGTEFIDPDLSGRMSLFVANGHIDKELSEYSGVNFEQEAQFYVNDGRGNFQDVSAHVGSYFRQRRLGRGVAYADFDNDGRPDLAVSHNDGPLALLRNTTATSNEWLRLELIGGCQQPGDGKSNRNAVGARVEIECGGQKLVRWVVGGGSYLSASERRLLVGLGSAPRAEVVRVKWPSGETQEFRNLEARTWYRLHEGKPQAETVQLKGGAGLRN